MNEQLVDLIVGDLVRETNIFPNQVWRAKEIIRKRLKEFKLPKEQIEFQNITFNTSKRILTAKP